MFLVSLKIYILAFWYRKWGVLYWLPFIIEIKSHSDKHKRSCVTVKLLQNNHELNKWEKFGRKVKFKKGEIEPLRWISKLDFDPNDIYSIQLIWENLPHLGNIQKTKYLTTNLAELARLYDEGYESVNNQLVLYETPPTSNKDWSGEVSFTLIPNNATSKQLSRQFRSIPFSFKDGKNKGTSQFNAEWTADGTPQN